MNKQFHKDIYTDLYRIRSAEKAIQRHYKEDEMKTPMHMSMGGEAISVGVCAALSGNDDVYGTYRSHALYIVCAKETEKFFGEMYGKVTGTAKGKAGSMHIASPENGLIMTSAVVSTTIPIATGSAFAHKVKKDGGVTTVFFGDGAVDEGVFWESVNLACVQKLPVLFVCEDNNFAIHTPVEKRRGYDSLTDVIRQFKCAVFQEETTDAELIYETTKKAIETIKKNNTPALLNLSYYRYLEHVGVGEDFDAKYRDKKIFEEWHSKDPIMLYRKKCLENKIQEEEIKKIEYEIDEEIKESVEKAKNAPYAKSEETYKSVYYE